jgi:hypothetical protein
MAVNQIVQVEPNSLTEDAIAGLRLKNGLLDIFTDVFEKCIRAERVEISNKSQHINGPMNPMSFMDEAYTEMVELAKKSKSETIKAHFANEGVLKVHAQTLANHFGTCIYVERSWWADQNPEDEEAKIFKAR